jgi:hypothetical protein
MPYLYCVTRVINRKIKFTLYVVFFIYLTDRKLVCFIERLISSHFNNYYTYLVPIYNSEPNVNVCLDNLILELHNFKMQVQEMGRPFSLCMSA